MAETNVPKGPVARKLVAALRRQQRSKVVLLDAVRAGKAAGAEVSRAATTPLEGLPLAHSIYMQVTNALTVMLESLQGAPELRKLAEKIAAAEDAYMPEGPPMSPLTASFFWNWALFDMPTGPKDETFASIIGEVGATFGMDPNFLSVLGLLGASRLGFHVHDGHEGRRVWLRELLTGERRSCVCASGHLGEPGELWLARVLPPPVADLQESVVITTPCVVLRPAVAEWQAFMRRTSPKTGVADEKAAYARLMKRGLSTEYWAEYVFEAYVNHRPEVIFLEGLPDVDESRPHSRASEKKADAPKPASGATSSGPTPDRKISETLMEFAEPVIDMSPEDLSPEEAETMLRLPWLVWNAVVMDGGKGTTYLAQARARLEAAPTQAPGALALFDMLVRRKRELFGQDRRLLGEVSVKRAPDGGLTVRVEARMPP